LFEPNYGGLVIASSAKLNLACLELIGRTHDSVVLIANHETIELNELIDLWQAKLNPVFPLTIAPLKNGVNLVVNSKVTTLNQSKSIAKPRVIIPVFPGTNCEYDTLKAFNQAGGMANSMVFKNLSVEQINQSIAELAIQINQSQILMLPGGFSAGDEPDGSAKFIATILRNPQIKDAVHELLARDGLILGVCNGFQALVKSGLLPYGEIRDLDKSAPTLTYNLIGRHISRVVPVKVTSTMSPWLSSCNVGDIHNIAMSHGEGRFVISDELVHELASNGQVASQYADLAGLPTMDAYFNPNGSDFAIESICSSDGRILGKMGHAERKGSHLYKNITGNLNLDIFANGVNYFR
jgi:phosphoribosylformylglycinamidine synthase